MNDTDHTTSDADPQTTDHAATDADRAATDSQSTAATDRSVETYLYWTALAVLVLLALIAVIQFYTSTSRAISIWVTREYRPLFQAAFNLVVLLAAGVGISLLVRRLATR